MSQVSSPRENFAAVESRTQTTQSAGERRLAVPLARTRAQCKE